jgi:plastocyanin
MRIAYFVIPISIALGCGGDDGGGGADAPPSAVMSVTCPGSPAATITTTGVGAGAMFSPMSATVPVGGIVRFMPGSGHDVQSTGSSAFGVGLAGNGCFQFNAAGTYPFRCSPHGFTGSIVVN